MLQLMDGRERRNGGRKHFDKQCIAVHLRLTTFVNSSMHQHYILYCAHRAQVVHVVTALAGVHGGGMERNHDLLVKHLKWVWGQRRDG